MNNLPQKLNILDKEIKVLAEKPCFDNAQKAINAVIGLFGVQSDNSWKLFNDSNGKIRSNSGWFKEAEGFGDRRATYKIADDNDKNIDFKAYWVKNAGRSIISWLVALTPNFEDEDFDLGDKVGIDFIVPEKADKIIVALSNRFVVRTLALSGSLSITEQEIFAKWLQEFDFKNKAQLHNALWESFDFEPVNKKFFKEISGFFTELRQYLSEDIKIFDEKHSAYFTNRLIGRIVFCWFLDKKGIINPEMEYFSAGVDDSSKYYNKKLEVLFFKVLNTPVDAREDKIEKITPFLNGGLFEIRENDRFEDSKLSFPADYFHRFFKFLNHYNFTTDESTSAYQQVAIDPEMLGRIFENLLAEQTEDTGQQARKAKGAFYTPREIVDYMCRESLREYLKTKIKETEDRDAQIEKLLDKKPHDFRDQQRNYRGDLKPYKYDILKALDELKMLDPACGSGAFPMGMLHLLLQVYERLEATFDPYKKKLDIIKNNLHGVDIEPMAVEISRLRAWLSIVVDEEADSKNIKPLPNLDFKFICANSLIPLDDNRQTKMKDEAEDLEGKMQEIREKYFNARSFGVKKELKEKFGKLLNKKNQGNLFGKSKKMEQLESYHPFDSENVAEFFDPEFMFGVREFDLVIGNPPYVKEYTSKDAFSNLKSSPYYQGKMDLWYFFACYGLDILKDNGIQAFIAPNNWISNFGAKKLRNKILEEGKLIKFFDFGDYKVFDTAGIQTMIYIIKKTTKNNDDYIFQYGRIINKKISQEYLVDFLNEQNSSNFTFFCPEINKKYNIDKPLSFISENINIILGKIKKQQNFKLLDNEVGQGIVGAPDRAFKIKNGDFNKFNEEEKKFLKIFHTNVNRFFSQPAKDYIFYISNKNFNGLELSDYPNIFKHFEQFKNQLKLSKIKYKTPNKPYFYLHRERDAKFFQKGPKIICATRTEQQSCAYSENSFYGSRALNFIKTERIDLKYLVALLNSRIADFWLIHKGKKTGDLLQVDKGQLVDVPIYKATAEQQKPFIKLVDQILEKKKENPKADTGDLEREIDEMVYGIYGLTEEEIGVVENK